MKARHADDVEWLAPRPEFLFRMRIWGYAFVAMMLAGVVVMGLLPVIYDRTGIASTRIYQTSLVMVILGFAVGISGVIWQFFYLLPALRIGLSREGVYLVGSPAGSFGMGRASVGPVPWSEAWMCGSSIIARGVVVPLKQGRTTLSVFDEHAVERRVANAILFRNRLSQIGYFMKAWKATSMPRKLAAVLFLSSGFLIQYFFRHS